MDKNNEERLIKLVHQYLDLLLVCPRKVSPNGRSEMNRADRIALRTLEEAKDTLIQYVQLTGEQISQESIKQIFHIFVNTCGFLRFAKPLPMHLAVFVIEPSPQCLTAYHSMFFLKAGTYMTLINKRHTRGEGLARGLCVLINLVHKAAHYSPIKFKNN